MKPKPIHSSIADFLIIVMIFTGCAEGGGSNNGTEVTSSGAVSLTLPFIPIEIVYDFLSNKIRVSISNKIQTPFGTFGISAGVVVEEKKYILEEKKYKSLRKLRIEAGDKLYIYKLEKDRKYSINIPTDVDGNTKLETTGTDGDITVIIPHPTNETIAELREKIRLLEIQAIERAQETPQAQSGGQGSDVPSGDDSAPQGAATDAPLSSPDSDSQPPPAAELRRTVSGIYKGSVGVADIRESEAGGFSFVLTTPRCSREAIGRALWKSSELAESVSPIREDATGLEYTTPTESTCNLFFTFSGDGLIVEKVGDNCHCNYAGLYSLY
jgi:hypothetical protein